MTKDYTGEFYIDNNNVIRWTTNDQVPFDDILTDFLVKNLVDTDTVVNSIRQRKAEASVFIEAYVARRKQYGYSDEEKFEMRAAFGDEEVVDIFTGKNIAFN